MVVKLVFSEILVLIGIFIWFGVYSIYYFVDIKKELIGIFMI